jgi:flagellar hook-basal body complex protein FliE
MSEPSKKLPRATIAQAKAAWEAVPSPSLRTVSRAMREAGMECPTATLRRWKNAKWVLQKQKRGRKTTAEQARAKVKHAVEDVEEKALASSQNLEIAETEREAELNKVVLTSELSEMALRKSLIAQIILAEQVARYAAPIVALSPGKIGGIMDSLKGPAASTTIVLPPQESSQNGDGAKVVNGRMIEESPTQLAITAFKQRQKQSVAA